MPPKPKVAFYWCASCGGCEEAIVDLAEDLLPVTRLVDIVFWPCAMDFKRCDLEAQPDATLAVTFLNGAIRSEEQAEMAGLLRRKSQLVVAYGACAQLGGIPGLANQFPRETLLRWYFADGPSTVNPEGTRPAPAWESRGHALHLPMLHQAVRALDQVIAVDYYLPGCPPTPQLTQAALRTILAGQLPPRGSVLAPDTALCDECPRKDSKPADLHFKSFHRPHLTPIDPAVCMLAQGFLCMGPATRAGCGALCVRGNMPCSGCFGPTSRVRDQGAKMLSSVCANVDVRTEKEIQAVLDGIPDPVGTFYRYSLARSLLKGGLPAPT